MIEIRSRVTTQLNADEAIGQTVAQYLFALNTTRATLGTVLGVTGQGVSNRLHGKAKWTVTDLLSMATYFGVRVADFMPKPDGQGGWIPAPYKPAYVGGSSGETLVGPVGIEPTTHGLKVRCSAN